MLFRTPQLEKNEHGLRTCVSNADSSESWSNVGKTRREKKYLQAKKEWKEAKADSDVDEEEKERLNQRNKSLSLELKHPKGELNGQYSFITWHRCNFRAIRSYFWLCYQACSFHLGRFS